MRIPTLSLCTIALCAGSLLAQTQTVYWNDGSTVGTAGGNAFPFGSDGIRYQSIMTAAQLPTTPGYIQDILVAGRSTDINVHYGDIEIKMGLTAQASPTTVWATNNPNPTTVYRGPLTVTMRVGNWHGIGLPNPYLFIPNSNTPNLCVEITVWQVLDKGNSSTSANFYSPEASGNVNRAFRYQWTTNQTQAPLTGTSGQRWGLVFNSGNFTYSGYGCAGSNTQTPLIDTSSSNFPQLGVLYPLTLTNGPASAPVFLFLGADFQKFAGLVPLPFDLQPFGAPKCMVWNDHLLALPSSTDASGVTKVGLTLPKNLPSHLRVYASWWCYDPKANKLGFTTSNLGTLIY